MESIIKAIKEIMLYVILGLMFTGVFLIFMDILMTVSY